MTSPVFTVRLVLLALSSSAVAAQTDARWIKVFADSSETIAVDSASVLPVGDAINRVWERGVSRQTSDAEPRDWDEIPPNSRFEAEWQHLCSLAAPGAGRR